MTRAGSSVPTSSARPIALWVAIVLVFAITVTIRFLGVTFANDHFMYLAPAQQVLFGEWPSRDFVDPGTPLMYVASAAAQIVAGRSLLAETLLVSCAFASAAAITLHLAYRTSGFLAIAILLSVVQVAMFPRTYHYPKLLVYAVGVLAMWRYVDAPSKRRAALLAAAVVIAFLFRHDHGVYLGIAAVAAAALARPGMRAAAIGAAHVMLFGVLFVAPYLVYLARTTGIAPHVASGLAYSRSEAVRTILARPSFDFGAMASNDNARVWLFYTFHALPVIALAMVLWRAFTTRSEESSRDMARIVPVAILGIAANFALLRDPLQARLPDVAVPVCVLAAWAIPRVWQASRARFAVRALLVAVVLVSLRSVTIVGDPLDMLNRANLLPEPRRALTALPGYVSDLRQPIPPARHLPSQIAEDLVPFLEYVGRCTAPTHRLFVAGEAPELYVLAQRPFAGGQYALRTGFFGEPEDQQRLVARMRRQQVPLALVVTDSDASRFTLVMQAVEADFRPLTEIEVEGRGKVLVRMSTRMPATGSDAQTGFPCFR